MADSVRTSPVRSRHIGAFRLTEGRFHEGARADLSPFARFDDAALVGEDDCLRSLAQAQLAE
jgi:hypothetical protein